MITIIKTSLAFFASVALAVVCLAFQPLLDDNRLSAQTLAVRTNALLWGAEAAT